MNWTARTYPPEVESAQAEPGTRLAASGVMRAAGPLSVFDRPVRFKERKSRETDSHAHLEEDSLMSGSPRCASAALVLSCSHRGAKLPTA